MPTMAQLAELASQLYVGNPSIGAIQDKYNIQFDSNSSTAKSLGLTPSFYVWSGEEYSSSSAYSRGFASSSTGWIDNGRYDSGNVAVCLGAE